MRLSARSKPHNSTIVGLAIIALTTLAACEDVSHESIDKWVSTQKGPEKLRNALTSNEHAVDLRAHAAQRMIGKGNFVEVREMLGQMPESDRHAILAKLAPRLWDDAKIGKAMGTPSARQSGAKDALYELHKIANDETKSSIEDFLVEPIY